MVIQKLEPRVLLHTVTMNPTSDLPYSITFQVGNGFPVTFSGMTKGAVSMVSSGTYRYTPNLAALGTDDFTATYQPTYGGGYYGGYTPPPVTTTIPMSILFPSYGSSTDESYTNPDPATNTQYPTINYFVLKDNTLTITPDKGLLKNDTTAAFVSYLTAHQVGNGQYGHFDIQPNGGFTYTPFSSVFNSSFVGLTDSCEYYDTAPDGSSRPAGLVKVDLAEVDVVRTGQNITSLNPWIGDGVTVSAEIKGRIQGPPITYAWTIPGKAVESEGLGSRVPSNVPSYQNPSTEALYAYDDLLDADDLDDSSVKFYWVTPGPKTPNVSITVAGMTGSGSLDFDVQDSPDPVTAVELTVVTGQVEISGNVLRFGNSTTPGWQSSVVFPTNFPHSYQFRQTVNSVHIDVTMNGGSEKSFVSNAVAIDGLLASTGQSPSHYYNLGHDTPSIALRSTWRAITVSETFSLYDYFRPGYADFATTNPGIENLDAIFVPIRVADWQWCAAATSTDGLQWNLASHGGDENTTLHFDVERDSPIYDYHILYLLPTEIIGGEYFFDDDIFMN